MDMTEFRTNAIKAMDQIARYHESVPSRRVVSSVKPGYLRSLLPCVAPDDAESFETIQADIEEKILPGITHWSSPGFMAFFPCASSPAAEVAELYSNAFSGGHFNWICSPAVTELETIVLDWLAHALKLPECYTSTGSTNGGGVLHGTASEAILTLMVGARNKYMTAKLAHLPEGEVKEKASWDLRSRLVVVGSACTHSSTKKAAQILGVRYATVPVQQEDNYSMTGESLAKVLHLLALEGLEPFFLTATMGTTDVCAVDDFAGIASVLHQRTLRGATEVFVHVDAAYAGSALLLEEHQHLTQSFSQFHSFNVNPHKWMLVTFDCSATFVRNRADLTSALSIQPPYLRNTFSDNGLVTDYRDWEIPLGRRFRSLKLWFVLRSYGIRGLQNHIRKGILLGESLEAKLRQRSDLFRIFSPTQFALVTLQVAGATEADINTRTERVYETINSDGRFYLTSTVVNRQLAIRVCTAVAAVTEDHVQALFEELVKAAEAVGKQAVAGLACSA